MDKITERHTSRAAYVYIRQSTQFQVQHNQESSRRQYALAGKARQLGWQQIEMVDEDMGCSGSGSVKRTGFERMVAAVGMGQVGAVFSIEASRLARNNRDWHQLVDICGMVGTLIIDEDGIYDATVLNDRLLLGLKGTMSEFELALIGQRMRAGLLQKAQRGELFLTVAVGYIRTPDDRCEKDPDERVRAAIELVFRKFEQTGSARQTLIWFRQEAVALPATTYGPQGRRIEWRAPVYSTIKNFLFNPIYAGAYAFGRDRTETYVEAMEKEFTACDNESRQQTNEDHRCLLSLGEDLSAVWYNEKSDLRIKKIIVRTLVEEIVADVDTEPDFIAMTIHWKGGNHSIVRVKRTPVGHNLYRTDKEAIDMVRELAAIMPDRTIAATLNRLSHKTAHGKNWTLDLVRSLRKSYSVPVYDPTIRNQQGLVTMTEAAKLLGTYPMLIQRLIKMGIIESKQIVPYAPHLIGASQLQTQRVRDAVKNIRRSAAVPLTKDENQISINLS